jgi:hypothetical protein
MQSLELPERIQAELRAAPQQLLQASVFAKHGAHTKALQTKPLATLANCMTSDEGPKRQRELSLNI